MSWLDPLLPTPTFGLPDWPGGRGMAELRRLLAGQPQPPQFPTPPVAPPGFTGAMEPALAAPPVQTYTTQPTPPPSIPPTLTGQPAAAPSPYAPPPSPAPAPPVGDVEQWRSLVGTVATSVGVDPDLVMAVIQAESSGNPRAVSRAGAQGLMQLMPGTARMLGVSDPYDPEQNIRGGATLLRDNLARYGGDLERALAAYNAGPSNVGHWREIGETRAYVPRVLDLYNLRRSGGGPSMAATPQAQAAITTATRTIGTPYRWGGANPEGFDCSGLTLYAYAQAGMALPRTAQQQWDATRRVASEQARPGDLAFWTRTYSAGVPITHVGIYLGGNRVLMATAEGDRVRVIDMSQPYWQSRFMGFGRVGG